MAAHAGLLKVLTALLWTALLLGASASLALADEGDSEDETERSEISDEEDDEDDSNRSGGHGKGREGRGPDRGDDDEDHDEGEKDEEAREGGKRRGPGRFNLSNATFDGRHVDFSWDQTSCDLTEYRVFGVEFFDRIELPAPCKAEMHGHQVDFEADEAELRVHDNPNGLLRFEAEDNASMTLRVASGVDVAESNDTWTLKAGNLTGRIFLTDEDGRLAFDNGSRAFRVEDSKGNFLVHPSQGESREKEKVRDAIKERKVGGQIDVLVHNGSVVHEVLAFDDVIIKVHKKNDSAFRFLVDANLTEGRTFVVNFAPGAFQEGKIGVRFFDVDEDGLANEVPIQEADNLSDVLDIAPGEGPEFRVVRDEEGKHVLVAVPKFSVHMFEVQAVSAQLAPTVVYGVLLGAGFVAASAGLMLARRRTDDT